MALLNPYISFKDNARAALTFYQEVLGGQLDVMEFGAMGMDIPPGSEHLVMHGQLTTPGGLTLMAADTGAMVDWVAPSRGMSVALTGGPADLAYVQAAYDKLAVGASDVMPFAEAPWGDHYGQLTDKFGVTWMFDVHK